MSKAIELLKSIKQLFESSAPIAYKLIDGTEIMIDTLSAGGLVTKDGAAALEGEYTLENGTVVKVDATGMISEVTPKVEMESAKLKDGTALSISALEVGGTVMLAEALAAAGDYELEDGRVLTVGAEGKILSIKEAEIDMAKQATDAAAKFAVGTPEERLANLEIVAKALMQNCFGWRINEEEVKAATEAAIAVYKNGFSSQEDKVSKLEAKLSKQDEMITQLLDLCEQLAGEPGEEPPVVKKKFSHIGAKDKGSRLGKYAQALEKMKEENLNT